MVNPYRQALFAALLRYHHHGSIASFDRICKLAGIDVSSDRSFRRSNLLLACEMAGLIDTRYTNGQRSWCSAFDQDIVIRGASLKGVGTTAAWFDRNGHIPLVVSQHGETLLVGAVLSSQVGVGHACDFGVGFFSRVPPVRKIERLFVREETRISGPQDSELAQYFSVEFGQWRELQASFPQDRVLARTRGKYSGWRYEVLALDVGLRFSIAEPEWAFPLSANILNWDLRGLVRVSPDGLQVSTAFRLPGLLLRYMFANCKRVVIGAAIEFEGVPSDAAQEFMTFLAAGRSIND